MVTAFIGLGSNKSNPIKQLDNALQALQKIPQVRLVSHSKYYSNPPFGPPDQPDYINAVCQVETTLAALSFLHQLQEIEQAAGRVRDGMRWGARTLDLDLLVFGDLVMHSAELTLPHPEIPHRAFVLYPLSEIAPALVIPSLGAINNLLHNVTDKQLTVVT